MVFILLRSSSNLHFCGKKNVDLFLVWVESIFFNPQYKYKWFSTQSIFEMDVNGWRWRESCLHWIWMFERRVEKNWVNGTLSTGQFIKIAKRLLTCIMAPFDFPLVELWMRFVQLQFEKSDHDWSILKWIWRLMVRTGEQCNRSFLIFQKHVTTIAMHKIHTWVPIWMSHILMKKNTRTSHYPLMANGGFSPAMLLHVPNKFSRTIRNQKTTLMKIQRPLLEISRNFYCELIFEQHW